MTQKINVAKLKKEIERLRRLVYYDELTSLLNRRGFKEEAERMFRPAFPSGTFGRSRKPVGPAFCVLFLDLDNFKKINDAFGHETGDRVLAAAGNTLLKTLREGDIIGRWGGEEFIVALYGTRVRAAQRIAERIRKIIATLSLTAQSRRIPVTASIGIASHGEEKDLLELITKADMAMYEAKRRGKNQVVFFEPGVDSRSWLARRGR